MRFLKLSSVALALFALASFGRCATGADDPPTDAGPEAKGPLADVAAYVDEQTIAVARLDLTRLKLGEFGPWLDEALRAAGADAEAAKGLRHDLAEGLPAAQAWLDGYARAGVRDVYVVVGLAGLPQWALVIPVREGADAAAIEKQFNPPETRPGELHSYGFPPSGGDEPTVPRAMRVGPAVVVAPTAALARLRAMKPADRPDLAEALGACGDAPVAVALALPADARRVIEELEPKLPPQAGGGPSTVVTRGLKWVSLALRPPPGASLALTARASDADAAKALAGIVGEARAWLAGQPAPELKWLAGVVAELAPAPSPERPQDLVKGLQGERLARLVAGQALAVQKARRSAASAASMNNMKQVLLGCIMYANAHKDEWPDDLEQVIKEGDFPADLLDNPLAPDSRPGYTYVNPGRMHGIKSPSTTMVLYETEPQPAGRGAGFADGHVELVTDAEFQKHLKEGKK